MRHRRLRRVSALSIVIASMSSLAGAGCSDSTSVDSDLVLGTIEISSDPIRANVPDTVLAGGAFPVTVLTYGDGCYEATETRVTYLAHSLTGESSRVAEVVPYDRRPARAICTSILRTLEHEAFVDFAQPGEATVRIKGLRDWSADTVTIDLTVVVE